MDIKKLVTVIPLCEDALQKVETPFVTFEHEYKTKPAWIERQVEASQRVTARVLLGDTWPDAQHDPLNWGRASSLLKKYDQPQPHGAVSVWPETAIYYTGVAQMYRPNPNIKYRPHMHFFGQYYDACAKHARRICGGDDIDVTSEAVIHVPDRNIYEVTYPKLQLRPADRQLSVIVIGDSVPVFPDKDVQVIRMSNDTTIPAGERFNRAVEQTTGERIGIASSDYDDSEYRWERQLEAAVDFSIGPVRTRGQGLEKWIPYNHTHSVDKPGGQLATMMFSRQVFVRLGGACAEMSVGFGYDMYLRIFDDEALTTAYHTDPLVAGRPYSCCEGTAYTQNVYNDAANRSRYTVRGYHARTILRKRPLVERS